MDPYDKEKTRQIWKRVLGEEETPVCALDSAALRTWIAEKKTDACTYEAMARQAPAGRELLRRLGREARCHARRLEAVYYLWTGEAAEAVSGPLPRQESLCAALRARHRAELEAAGKLTSVVTQNIDGLHQRAGSRRVWELHGSVHRNHCMRCGRAYPVEFVRDSGGVPRCACGGIVKPDVVLYEEQLDGHTLQGALSDIQGADMLIIGGTSLAVYPAASLVNYYRGHRLVLINKSPTPYDAHADLVIAGPIGEILGGVAVV